MKAIPTLEDVSPEYARLSARQTELLRKREEGLARIRELHMSIGSEQAQPRAGDRVAALIAGVDYAPPAPIKDQIAEISRENQLIDQAVEQLAGEIALERTKASRLVVAQFETDRVDMASRFFEHIAAAAAIHAEYGEIRRHFHRAGVDPAGFSDFGMEIFGDPAQRNGDVGIAMRAASRKGYLKDKQIPEAYR